MASEEIPTPPPPPPLLNNENTNTTAPSNGSTTSQAQSSSDGGQTVSTDGAKPWQRPWTVDEMRKGATSWSLASDAGLLLYMQEFSQNMLSQTHSMAQKVDGLVDETKGISAKVHNTFNDFLMLSNTQFIENRVYDEEETKDEEAKQNETVPQEKEKTREEIETEVIPKINEAIHSGLAVLDSAFVTVEITPEQLSDDEEEGALPENLKPEPILELTDVYAHRKLPSFIGTPEFHHDDLVGLGESSSEDEEGSDKEASVESETEKSTEDEETSESETVSGSESEEGSTTATESESETEVVAKKKARKESSQADSDDDLFAASGTQKSTTSKQAEDDDDDSDESMEEEEDENEQQTRKPAAPMDFSAELAARLGVKAKRPVDDSDEEGGNDEDWGESEKHENESTKDDLLSTSLDTTASVSSKSSKRKDKKHKKSKPRSSSRTSHDSVVTPTLAVGNVANEVERSQRHGDGDGDDDDLFTSSIDTTSSVVSKGSKSKHKHKKKAGRSDSQLSSASSKSSQKESKTTFNKDEDNLFSGSPDGDLFDDHSPFGKKGGRFSGGGGLFDDVMDDDDETSKPDSADTGSKASHGQDESDEEVVKPKPRTASGKKLPAGAVSIFGDQGAFGHMPVQTGEHHIAKSTTSEKKESKSSTGGGGLFSDEGEDIFTSSQSSSIISTNKPPAAVPKAKKSVDLFGSGDDEEDDDDDSLFGVKAPKKAEPKAEPPKKKLPAGAVSIFGNVAPPPLFSASNTESETPVASSAVSGTSNVKAPKEASGLFDEDDDKTSSFNSERSAVSSNTGQAKPVVQAKRKTNQISLFDNDDEEDGDGDDLFASIAPSKTLGSTANKTVSKPEQPTESKPASQPVSKPGSKRSTISLFDDDDDEDDDESDIFSIKPPAKSHPTEVKPPEVKPALKSSAPSPGLFTAEDPLFAGSITQAAAGDASAVTPKADVRTNKQENKVPLVDEDDDDDLFAEPKAKIAVVPAVTEPVRKEAEKDSEDLFDADSDEKDETDGVKSDRKILPGAVPMFGGVDIFAGQKPGKNTRAKPQGDSLFADDEDDLFATPPKPVPTVAPRAKPRKPPAEAPQPSSSSPLKGSDLPEHTSPLASSSNKNTNVGKLQKTLAFNPAAMLPGAAPPKKRDTKNIMFNPATMLPGAVPPPRKQENAVEATFDKPASEKLLQTSGRDRARLRGKRRPPTRQARQKAARECMDDTSLFGSNLAAASTSIERLTGAKGGPTSLFSDSDDLFSSNSYKAPAKNNQKPHTTQSNTSKFDPLFVHNSMTSDFPSFEDSIDGIPNDSAESKKDNKDNVYNTKEQAKKPDLLFENSLKDELFSTSTESDSSFLPKSNIAVRHASKQESTQKSKSLIEKRPKDDLFSLSTESETSISHKNEVLPQSVRKAEKVTKSVVDKKADVDDLFNRSTESNISQKAKRNEKSENDLLFGTQNNDDLFSQSEGRGVPQKGKPKGAVATKKTQNSKSDLRFDSKPNEDLFSQSTDSTISEKGKPATTVPENKSPANLIFDNPPKDYLFNQSTETKTSQKSKPKDLPVKNDETKVGSLFDSKPEDDLFNQSVKSNTSNQAKPDLSAEQDQKPKSDPLFDGKVKDDLASQVVESKKSSSQKVQVADDDEDDEDDLFKPNSRPLFSPPPLDFDSDLNASGDFAAQGKPKTVTDDIFNDDDDIFAPKPNKKKENENKTEKEKTKVDKKNEKENVQEKGKSSEEKKTTEVDDLFADTGSIFDDLPKKSKEKKKKKTTASKEESIFDDTKDATANESASTSKTTKKTKGKKKGKSKTSIFDEDSPSIFDDPLNATLK